jgi:hypothetical protein
MDCTDRVPARSRSGTRFGPWMAPAVVVAEVVLVLSGVLSLRWAVISGVALEIVLAAVIGGRLVVATKGYVSSRASGRDLWTAAEDGLAQVVPRPLARFIVVEPRLWWALAQWCTGRPGRGSASFGYHRGLRLLFWAIFIFTCVELVVVDTVLVLAVSDRIWLWISLGLHLYALVALLGFWASFVTRPHLLGPDELALRDGVFGEVAIPYSAIVDVAARTANAGGMGGRSGLRIDEATRTARLSVGTSTTVVLSLDPTVPVRTGRGEQIAVDRFLLTVDRPGDFVASLRDRVDSRGSR